MGSPRHHQSAKEIRARRTRAPLRGTPERPRLSVFRSNRHIFVQLIDDTAGRTLASASDAPSPKKAAPTSATKPHQSSRRSVGAAAKGAKATPRHERAHRVGEEIATRARAQGVAAVRFDRGGQRYHGLVKAVAEGARKGGLKF